MYVTLGVCVGVGVGHLVRWVLTEPTAKPAKKTWPGSIPTLIASPITWNFQCACVYLFFFSSLDPALRKYRKSPWKGQQNSLVFEEGDFGQWRKSEGRSSSSSPPWPMENHLSNPSFYSYFCVWSQFYWWTRMWEENLTTISRSGIRWNFRSGQIECAGGAKTLLNPEQLFSCMSSSGYQA